MSMSDYEQEVQVQFLAIGSESAEHKLWVLSLKFSGLLKKTED